MVEHVYPAPLRVLQQAAPAFVRGNENVQGRHGRYVLGPDLGIAGDRYEEEIIEPCGQRFKRPERAMAEHAEALAADVVFWQPVEMLQRGLGTPADEQAAEDMCLRPVEDARQLPPVRHGLEVEMFHRCTG